MRSIAVRKNDPVPLYYQVAEQIRERIASGALRPGDRLSSAREMSEQAGISRMTVYQALGYLERQGHVVVRHGAGTFVAEPKLTYHAVHLLGFTQEMLDQGQQPSSRVLEQTLEQPSAAVAERLRLGADDRIVKVVRLRLSGDVPVLLETVSLSATACPGLEREDLREVSLYQLLEERYHLRPARSRQRMEATVATAAMAEVFAIPAGTPMLRLDGVTHGAGDQPIEHFQAVFRGDRFQLEFESHGPEEDRPMDNGQVITQLLRVAGA